MLGIEPNALGDNVLKQEGLCALNEALGFDVCAG